MADIDSAKRAQAMAVFKLAAKTSSKAVHRTLNRPAQGKGWVQCANMPAGIVCRPDRVRESIELFKKGYAIFPDIVALNQIALHYEMLGEAHMAKEYFSLMKAQAERESNPVYVQAAGMGLARIG